MACILITPAYYCNVSATVIYGMHVSIACSFMLISDCAQSFVYFVHTNSHQTALIPLFVIVIIIICIDLYYTSYILT